MNTCPVCNEDIMFALPGPNVHNNPNWVDSILNRLKANDGEWPVEYTELWECPICGHAIYIEFTVHSTGAVTDLNLTAGTPPRPGERCPIHDREYELMDDDPPGGEYYECPECRADLHADNYSKPPRALDEVTDGDVLFGPFGIWC
jgi:hypothetical protein